MTEQDHRMDFSALAPLEELLEGFRPVSPPAALRQRVLEAALAVSRAGSRRRVALGIWRAAVAAGLVAAIWLNVASDRIASRVAGQVGAGPPVWTQQAEEAAQLLDGQGWGRQYVAMGLMAGPLERAQAAWPQAVENGVTPLTQ